MKLKRPERELVSRGVVKDPEIQWGAATIVGTRIQTEIIYGMIHSCRGEVAWVAEMYDITEQQVIDARDYEKGRRHETT